MDQPPPLTPQEIAAMQVAQHADLGQPQQVKVFGILHVIFAGFGLLSSAWGLLLIAIGNPFMLFLPKTPQMEAQAKVQEAMQAKMMPMTVISTVLTVTVGLIMLRAGILLLKKRRGGLYWSNLYSYVSLAAKAVNLVLAFIYTVPAMKEMTNTMAGGGPTLPGVEWIMIGSMLLGIVIAAAYPIAALVLLNRPNVKQWFSTRPE